MTVHHNNDNNDLDLGEDQTYQRLVNINAVIKGYNQMKIKILIRARKSGYTFHNILGYTGSSILHR